MASSAMPVRQKSAGGIPAPTTSIERCCVRCGASFLGLAYGRTGEVGIWSDWQWFCSQECFDGSEHVLTPTANTC
jgi:hypothetical protein